MAVVVVLDAGKPDPFVRLIGALTDTGRIMVRIGAIMEAGAQQAFVDQRFGAAWPWPHRYPNQSEPFVNIAGALSDFNKGATKPKQRRFDRRPAVRDTGELMRSARSRVASASVVEVGSTVPYAAAHQWGLVTTQPITPEAKKRIAKWLLKPGGRPYADKMSVLLQRNRTTLDTKHVQRPIFGVTPEMEPDIVEAVETMVAEAANGGAGGDS